MVTNKSPREMSLLPFKEHDDLNGQHELLLEIFIDVWLQEGKKNNEQQKCVADAKNNQQGRKKREKACQRLHCEVFHLL